MHIGPPDDIESYLEETGRARRDGLSSSTNLLVKKRLGGFIEKDSASIAFYLVDWKGYEFNRFLEECCDLCTRKKNEHTQMNQMVY